MWVKSSNKSMLVLATLIGLLCGVYAFANIVDFAKIINQTKPDTAQQTTNTKQATPAVVPEKPILLAAAGDFDYNQNTANTFKNISQQKPDYVLALGDLSYGKTTEQQWCSDITKAIGKTPFLITTGNHDIEPNSQIDLFTSCLPNRIAGLEGNYPNAYYFDHQKTLRVISITPNIALHGKQNNYSKTSEEYRWLEQAVADAHKQNIRWIVLTMHKNCITAGEKTCEIGQDLSDYIMSGAVDLALQGHEHGYMRSYQLKTDATSCKTISPIKVNQPSCIKNKSVSTYKKGEGTIQAIVGTGGAELRGVDKTAKSSNLFAILSGANQNPMYGALRLNVTNNALKAEFIDNQDYKTKDIFTISYTPEN